MSEIIQKQTCGNCGFYVSVYGISKPYCYGMPPTIFNSGDWKRPQPLKNDPACSLWKPMTVGESQVLEKVLRETPGSAAKDARESKQGIAKKKV